MKKLLFPLCAFTLLAIGCGPDRAKAKKTFSDACATAAKKEVATNGAAAIPDIDKMIDDYCECSGEKVVNGLTDEELKAINKDASALPQSRVEELAKTCTDAFIQKVQAKAAAAQ